MFPGLKAPTKAVPRLHDTPGTVLRLMVVSTGQRHCAGIDIDSGALARAWAPAPIDQHLRPYDLVAVTVADNPDILPDPSEAEAIVIAGPPVPVGRLKGRRALRLIRPMLHPENVPLLGFHGPTVPFWERRADHPSVALAAPRGPVVVTVDQGALWCRFSWGNRPQVLACSDPRLAASLQKAQRRSAELRAGTFVLVALEPPVDGLCRKVVEALLPRR
jgi:hypothetical protein